MIDSFASDSRAYIDHSNIAFTNRGSMYIYNLNNFRGSEILTRCVAIDGLPIERFSSFNLLGIDGDALAFKGAGGAFGGVRGGRGRRGHLRHPREQSHRPRT